MQFKDTSTKQGLIEECEFNLFGEYGTISGDSDVLATFTRLLNNGLNRVGSLIMKADHRWQWDDDNNTDHPIATANLVAEQQDYALEPSHMIIQRMEVKDAQGGWHKLKPIDQADLYDSSLTEFMSGTGLPLYYDKLGSSIFLYPKPSESISGGLKVFFQREPNYFVAGDTTKEPGINKLFHRLVALIACRDYALMKQMSNGKTLAELVAQGEEDLQEFYSGRDKDDKIKLTAKKFNFK